MADSPCDNTFRVATVSIAGSAVYDCVGGSIQETCEYLENRPGTFVSACIGLDKYSCKAVGKYQKGATPVARGTLGSTVFGLKQFDGGTVTVTVVQTRAGAANADFDSKPHSYSQEAVFDNGGVENLAAWSVAG